MLSERYQSDITLVATVFVAQWNTSTNRYILTMSKRRKAVYKPHPNPYLELARIWLETCPSKGMFSSYSGVAMTAVAEYLANEDGKTLWDKNGQLVDKNHERTSQS